MSHLTEQIASLRAELAELEAIQLAEDAAQDRANQNRPAGIPPTWKPVLFKVNGSFDIIAWHDPNYTVSTLRLAVATPPTAPTLPTGGQP